MPFDFADLDTPTNKARPTDPIELFRSSTIADSAVNDLWLGQGDALRAWHTQRDKRDIAIALNTGAGKTLVGLLVAQSLVNETRRQVVYACSSIQLVTQTAEKALGYGLPVATYHTGQFTNRAGYNRAKVPCLTTYHALFNGKSRFRRDDISAVVFDDAHTAENILRGQFSLTMSRRTFPTFYNDIWQLFRPYHIAVGKASSYKETFDGATKGLFLIPPHELLSHLESLRSVLHQANLTSQQETKFAWEHIRDHEDLCCLLISDESITLTPLAVPTNTMRCFQPDVRRIYLSATLSAPDALARAFGRTPTATVAPSTSAGECERMILFPSSTQESDDDLEAAKQVIKGRKALILVPSFPRGELWADVSEMPKGEAVTDAITAFRESTAPEHLTLASRYDGIDLPGDSCRVMVLDDLPAGTGVLERFQWERLQMESSLNSTLASRIVQSFGRISRGMSDPGIVLVTGHRLVDWLAVPRNRALLPQFLAQQLAIGEKISDRANNVAGLVDAANASQERDPQWVNYYSNEMKALEPDSKSSNRDEALKITLAESAYVDALWERRYDEARGHLSVVSDRAFHFSRYTGGWLSLWLGFAMELSGDKATANEFYSKAEAAHSNVPRRRPPPVVDSQEWPFQVERVIEQLRVNYSGGAAYLPPGDLHAAMTPLEGGKTPPQTEEAMRRLGQFLGLISTRPDKEHGTGPDVLWYLEDEVALCMELKTDKSSEATYTKSDVGQLHNHVQWVKSKLGIAEVIPLFVGPRIPVRPEASPSPDMKVVELQEFGKLGEKVAAVLADVASSALPLYAKSEMHDAMKGQTLMYPDLLAFINMRDLLVAGE